MNATRWLAYGTAAAACLRIVAEGAVRITGSASGCGDTWPLCHGQVWPSLQDPATFLAWTDRALGAATALLTVTLLIAVSARRGRAGDGRALHPTMTALLLLVIHGVLDATGASRGPAGGLVSNAATLGLVAVVLVVGMGAGSAVGSPGRPPNSGDRRAGAVTLILGGLGMLTGGLTADAGAAGACLGFPLCDGRVWPAWGTGGGLSLIHWTHRVAGFALVGYLVGRVALPRRPARRAVRGAEYAALAAGVMQLAVSIALMTTVLQPRWRALHTMLGAATWVAVVIVAWQAGRGTSPDG